MLKKALSILALLVAVLVLTACRPTPPSDSDGTADRVEILLPQGSVEAGRQAFVNLGCTACHTVSTADGLPQPSDPSLAVDLAVSVRGLSRSGIVTSIIEPSHVDSQSTELWADWSDGQRVWLGPGATLPETPAPETEEPSAAPVRTRMLDYRNVMTVKQLCDLTSFIESARTSSR